MGQGRAVGSRCLEQVKRLEVAIHEMEREDRKKLFPPLQHSLSLLQVVAFTAGLLSGQSRSMQSPLSSSVQIRRGSERTLQRENGDRDYGSSTMNECMVSNMNSEGILEKKEMAAQTALRELKQVET